jgi:glyoxylase-like metal-dependent hydrolase (beta-lactamase superfamily II)
MFKRVMAIVWGIHFLCAGCAGKVDLDRTGLVKLTGHVYAFIAPGPKAEQGLGANCGFVVGARGVLVVDSRHTPALAREVLDAVRTVTDAPILYLVDTHYHPDHTWGSSVFKEAGALVLACPGTKRLIETYSPLYLEYYKKYAPESYERFREVRVVVPDSTVLDGTAVDLGGVTVVLRCVGPAHTESDCIVTVPAERVAFMGGLLSNGYHPNIGDSTADIENWLAVLERIGGEQFRYLVPGQGTVCTPEGIETLNHYMRDLREQCKEAIRSKTPLEKAISEISIPSASGYEQKNLLPFNIQACYRREMLTVVRPPFEIDVPPGFEISDGGGGAKAGSVRWARETERGRQELEIAWSTTAQRDVIAQDIKDRIAQYGMENESLKMEMKGSKRVFIGEREALALYGNMWTGGEGFRVLLGDWMWIMHLEGETLYLFRLTASGGRGSKENALNLDELERLLATIRPNSKR